MGKHAPMKVAEPQMNMFAEEEHKIREAVKKINVEDLTPLEALNKIDEIKKMISDE